MPENKSSNSNSTTPEATPDATPDATEKDAKKKAADNAGRDDIHEQREPDQTQKGVITETPAQTPRQ